MHCEYIKMMAAGLLGMAWLRNPRLQKQLDDRQMNQKSVLHVEKLPDLVMNSRKHSNSTCLLLVTCGSC